ncbi:MAG: hypothetical protein UV51_C0010G0034 [Candidatus Woesebacteria bacterium GW2011_GWC1_42_9]|nr:MAG: hypothetical protein UV51_C0010G0034 [Candidatus Woesebacteria bacterium GW2011_GWC1_42_9]
MDTPRVKKHLDEINALLIERGTSRKTQVIRLVGDVLFISPVLIYAGARKSDLPVVIRGLLIGIGVATLYYNFKNFIQVEKIISDLKKQQNEK